MKLFGFAMLLFVIFSSGSQLQKRDPCTEGDTTVEMKLCAAKKYKEADGELNKAYRQLMSKLDDESHRTSLKTAQQAWLKYRDSNCDFEAYLNRGGSIYSVVVTECMTSMTSSRTKELKRQIENLERL